MGSSPQQRFATRFVLLPGSCAKKKEKEEKRNGNLILPINVLELGAEELSLSIFAQGELGLLP